MLCCAALQVGALVWCTAAGSPQGSQGAGLPA